jgi:tetratricopeptide (TPR) repeat protein
MEASRPTSPTPDQVQKNVEEKSECERSPTTVVEEVDLYLTKPIPSDVDRIDDDDAIADGFSETTYKLYDEKSSGSLGKEDKYSRLRRKQREQKKYLIVLPSIQESDEEGEEEGEEKRLGIAFLSTEDDISMHIQTVSSATNSEGEVKEVQLLVDAASQRSSRGNEDKALAIYKDGLFVLKQEVTRVLEQMDELARKEPKFEKTALFIILHEEWSESALVIADIRSKMATIYERREDYNEALRCSNEARSIYQRQAMFDARHQKKGSGAREKEISVENMIEQIEEAKESHKVRKSLHETVERIREKILATSDKTSKGFLYEDIFEKLTTALSLELMYLGETHPQIAYTKGLFSMLHSELDQNAKALKVMNDAILICEMALGDSHPQTGSKYQDAAKICERIGGEENISRAIDHYEKSITTLEKAEGNVCDRLCSSLNRVAVLYIQRKSYDIAITKLKRGIQISEENYRERSDSISTESVQFWLNLGECQALKGESELATEALKNALRIQRDKRNVYDLSRKSPGSIPDLISNSKIAFTMKTLGNYLSAESKFKQAYGCFVEALSILQTELDTAEELFKFNPTIDLPKYEDDVASALYDLAKAKQADTKYDEAVRLYSESFDLRKESDEKRSNSEKSNHIHCAMCLAGIGSIELTQNEAADAFESFNEALQYTKQQGMADSHPTALMLLEKSRIAANNMKKGRKPIVGSETEDIGDDDVVISRLDERAKELKDYGDLENCIKTLNIVIRMKRALLQKITKEEQRTIIKRQLATSIITKGEVNLINNAKKEATDCVNEASGMLKESTLDRNDEIFRHIDELYSEIKKLKRRKTIGERIRKMKLRSETTMAEF